MPPVERISTAMRRASSRAIVVLPLPMSPAIVIRIPSFRLAEQAALSAIAAAATASPGCGLPQRPAGEIAHQREAARKHAAMGECIEELSAACKRLGALTKQRPRGPFAAFGKRGNPLACPR